MLGLLSKDSPVLSAPLNNTLGSVCNLTSPKMQNELLDNVLKVFRKQVILEINQSNYLAVISDESTDISGQTQLIIVFRYIDDSSGVEVGRF